MSSTWQCSPNLAPPIFWHNAPVRLFVHKVPTIYSALEASNTRISSKARGPDIRLAILPQRRQLEPIFIRIHVNYVIVVMNDVIGPVKRGFNLALAHPDRPIIIVACQTLIEYLDIALLHRLRFVSPNNALQYQAELPIVCQLKKAAKHPGSHDFSESGAESCLLAFDISLSPKSTCQQAIDPGPKAQYVPNC